MASRKAFIKMGEGGAQPNISKEKIDEMKVKWKPYKITKKQIVSIYELL